MEEKVVDFGIDRTRYYGVDLKIISIVRLFQNADKLFKEFSNGINKSITSEKQKKKLMNTLIVMLKYVLHLILYSSYQERYVVK